MKSLLKSRPHRLIVAQAAPLPFPKKVELCKRALTFVPKRSLEPTRSSVPEIFDRRPPMFDDVRRAPWSAIEKVVIARCRGRNDWIPGNLDVSRRLHQFALENSVHGEDFDFLGYPVFRGERLIYATSGRFWIGGNEYVVHIDPRHVDYNFDASTVHVVLSFLEDEIQQSFDLRMARPAVLQLSRSEGSIGFVVRSADQLPLYPSRVLREMVQDVYAAHKEAVQQLLVEGKRKAS